MKDDLLLLSSKFSFAYIQIHKNSLLYCWQASLASAVLCCCTFCAQIFYKTNNYRIEYTSKYILSEACDMVMSSERCAMEIVLTYPMESWRHSSCLRRPDASRARCPSSPVVLRRSCRSVYPPPAPRLRGCGAARRSLDQRW